MKVFVTGAGALLGQGIIKSIRKSSRQAELIALDPSRYAAGLYWADRHYIIPMASHPDYLKEVFRLLEKEKPGLLLIGTDVELPVFSAKKQYIEDRFGCRVVVSSPEVINIANDKYLTYRFLKEKGFLYPHSCLPEDLDLFLEKVGFPLIVKPRVGARSIDVFLVKTDMELQESLTRVDNPVIQEYIGSAENEYTAGALVFEGRCEATIVMRRDLKDGNTYRAYVNSYEDYNREVKRLAEALGAEGPVNFQFRTDQDGLKVFEINARFSGTTPVRALAGFNEVEMVMERLLDGATLQKPEIKPITVLRYWEEMILPE